jgi:hypothetical protein
MSSAMIQWKCFLNTKEEWRLTIELNMLELYFHHVVVIFDGAFFVMTFLYLDMHILFFSFIVVCIHLNCYITNDVHFIMCVLCEKKWVKKLVDQKKKMYYFLQCSYKYFFWIKKYFDNILIIFFNLMHITSLLYNTCHLISTHVYLYKHVWTVINNVKNMF